MSNQHEHRLLMGALQLRAAEFAATLYPGATVDASDRVYLAEQEWGRYLDEALAERGLRLDGDVIVPLLRMASGE